MQQLHTGRTHIARPLGALPMEPSNLMPRINLARCTGCGLCIDICPTQALSQVNQKAALSAPQNCTLCDICENICPEQAIALPFLVFFAPSATTNPSGAPPTGAKRT